MTTTPPRIDRETGWQPIETAPHDGTRLLLYREGCIGFWSGAWRGKKVEFWHSDLSRKNEPHAWQPTHWMPLPDPPASPELKEREKNETKR